MSLLLLFRTGTSVPAAPDAGRVVAVLRGPSRTLYLATGYSRRRTVAPLDRSVLVLARPSREVDN